jgi:hypothetical protein
MAHSMHFPDKVEKVMAYGAPGLSSAEQKKWNKVLARESSSHPEINLFCQKNDPVPYFDRVAKKGFNYYQVVSGKSRKGVAAHAHMYSIHENCAIIRMTQSKIASKWKRISLTALRVLLSFLAFPLLITGHAVQTTVKKLVIPN